METRKWHCTWKDIISHVDLDFESKMAEQNTYSSWWKNGIYRPISTNGVWYTTSFGSRAIVR